MMDQPLADPFANGPYLATAIICERVLREQDGVLSLIRVVDRFFQREVDPDAPDRMPPITINATAVITIKAGEARGRSTVAIRPETPAGLKMEPTRLPVLFEGEDRGVSLVIQLQFLAELEGLYWFDILLDDRQLTRIPLRVVHEPTQMGPRRGDVQ